ncbi:sugar MFS transporter [Shewanella sp. FJAT-52076]|uniref:sugar MFS transporter n=1 Tax=Shewanella sp. FJAT-52076 TaxID=2864202 RepID=UPI001C656171|nr:sugar MFS transporter [Shewanella sp. FJAT-52076]
MENIMKTTKTSSTLLPMVLIGILFFVFGFVTWLNGALIPFLKIACELNELQAYMVTFVFYIAYFVMALPMSGLLSRFGYRAGLQIGLGVMALGALLFIPAAFSHTFGLFLLALFVLGTGLTILQTAANPYIVVIGPSESAAMRISCMGVVNKGAGILVPLIFSAWVLTGMDAYTETALAALSEADKAEALLALSARLVEPYLAMAAVLIALLFYVRFSPLPEPNISADESSQQSHWRELLKYPQVMLGALTLFLYVGAEVIAGDSIGLYGQHLGLSNFGVLTSYTMAFMVLGYLVGIATIPRFISQKTALAGSAIAGLVFTLGIMFGDEQGTTLAAWLLQPFGIAAVPDTVLCLALLGFANALVWPAVWPLALQGLGRLTATASALLIMGIAGGALLPLAYGALVQSGLSHQLGYGLLLPCYGMIFFYAVKGHRLRQA